MTQKTKLLLMLIVLSACMGLQKRAYSQSRGSASTPNSNPKVELVASTNPFFIDDVVFDGLEAITTSSVEGAFRDNLLGLTKGAFLVPANVEKGRKIIKQMLADMGYVNSRVQFLIESVSIKSRRITFFVDEGPPAVIRDIKVEGNKVLSDDELLSHLKLVSVMSHDVYDRGTLDYDLNNMRNFMRSRGYLEAKTLEPRLKAVNGNLTITIRVEEGKLYRIGEITVLDSKLMSAEKIIELMGLKKGDIADGNRISDFLYEELKNLYADMGYPQYSAEPDPEYKDNPDIESEGIVDLKITIDEGACYKIDSIEFYGNEKLTEIELRRFLLFKEGDIYNQQMIRDSLKAMNESGLFEPIDREADVVYWLKEDAHLATITIRVHEFQD